MAGKDKAGASAPEGEGGGLSSIDLLETGPKEIEADTDRALDPENPDEAYMVEVSRRELALLNLIRSCGSATFESIDVSQGKIISIKRVVNNINFGDEATTDALAKPTNPEDRIFLR